MTPPHGAHSSPWPQSRSAQEAQGSGSPSSSGTASRTIRHPVPSKTVEEERSLLWPAPILARSVCEFPVGGAKCCRCADVHECARDLEEAMMRIGIYGAGQM